MSTLRIGTRGSALALWQARTVGRLLEAAGHTVTIITISTGGDRLQHVPVSQDSNAGTQASRKALFVKEIEDALLDNAIDIAVHSAKDMSVVLPDGLDIAAVLPREDPRDALVLPSGAAAADVEAALAQLNGPAVIGTGSVRRAAQLAALLPRATFAPIRGNVDTRLRKLDGGEFDGLVLAAAGLLRLGMRERISAALPFDRCVPAPGQGIVAMEIRSEDGHTREALNHINDLEAAASLVAERAVVSALGGGCQLPLGAIALHEDGHLDMHAVVASADGRRIIRRHVWGPVADAARLGATVAADLAEAGAIAMLDEIRGA